jgi:hypothetical protein
MMTIPVVPYTRPARRPPPQVSTTLTLDDSFKNIVISDVDGAITVLNRLSPGVVPIMPNGGVLSITHGANRWPIIYDDIGNAGMLSSEVHGYNTIYGVARIIGGAAGYGRLATIKFTAPLVVRSIPRGLEYTITVLTDVAPSPPHPLAALPEPPVLHTPAPSPPPPKTAARRR